jgi:type II secretory pathway component PulF
VFDIDTTGYTDNDMDSVNHTINQIKKIRARLLKIPGFAKNVKDEAAQLKLAEKIFNLMKRGHTFDSALVLAQKNPGQQGVEKNLEESEPLDPIARIDRLFRDK